MASFFTQLRLYEDVADYWTFDCGHPGKVHTHRMVQGNSESPAIAQAFLLHVLSGALTLRDKLLVYIDNIYLKSISGDKQEHIEDIGIFVRVLAEANVTVNMRKSLWVATCDIEVLGREWSANGNWKPFDHRFLLAPFYAATNKDRLTKADNAELRQPWADLKQALLNVESLYIPPPGAPLVLRTDTARAGVGAVLLVQTSEDPEDLAPVSYFSCIFGGQQGAKHSTWREVCVVYKAVKYFYPYLDGCVNLRIETDCGTVVSLFAHKTNNDADQLAQFKIALTSMGVKKHMLVHQPSIKQETADWLSRAKERLRPRKVPRGEADIAIGSKDVIYTIRYLSASEDESGDESDSEEEASSESESDNEQLWPARLQGPPSPAAQLAVLESNLNLPRPSEYTECQQTDNEIQAWIALCMQHTEHVGELTPDYDVIEKKRLHDGILYELVNGSSLQDTVGTWVPVLSRGAASRYLKAVHEGLGHTGQTRLLNF
ncbi:hypothetical protein GGH96_006334, partial [Coemansia sp. RSA 1972]